MQPGQSVHLQPTSWLHIKWGLSRYRSCDQHTCSRLVLSQAYAPRATVGVDIDGDGDVDYMVTGADENRDGVPDVLQVCRLCNTSDYNEWCDTAQKGT